MESRFSLPSIPGVDLAAARTARSRQATLTKPPGSLGRLEDLAAQLAAITGRVRPSVDRKAVIVMAADHGVAAEGVSAYPAEVTAQMVANFLRGGAAINVLARQMDAAVVVVDVGVASPIVPATGLVSRKVAPGTRNMRLGPAMTLAEARQAISFGIDVVEAEAASSLDLIATGDMGIGNTTASAALAAVLTGRPVPELVGRGTGVDDAGLERKVTVIEEAIALNRPDPQDPLGVVAKVGGLEIAGLAGVILGAASRRIPIVLDGFISGAAALVACALEPDTRSYLVASHRSVEAGHEAVLRHLDLHPLLDLGLRLGEGTGAVLAFPLIEAAARLLDEMATFDEAGVSDAAEGDSGREEPE